MKLTKGCIKAGTLKSLGKPQSGKGYPTTGKSRKEIRRAPKDHHTARDVSSGIERSFGGPGPRGGSVTRKPNIKEKNRRRRCNPMFESRPARVSRGTHQRWPGTQEKTRRSSGEVKKSGEEKRP